MRRKIQTIVLVVFLSGISIAQAPGLLGVGAELGGKLITSDLATKVFEWLTKKPDAKETAKPKVAALYSDLLGLQAARNSLGDDLQQRLHEMDQGSSCESCARLKSNADQLGILLDRFGNDYKALALALDQAAPDISQYHETYITGKEKNIRPLQVTNVASLTKAQVQDIHDKLVANSPNFRKVISDYRAFVKENYSDIDLVQQ